MKALSIHAPWIDEIIRGVKVEEYRSWRTNYRGDILLCSSVKQVPGYKGVAPVGHALCIVTIDDITGRKGDYAWHVCNVRPIKPVPVKGKLHIYDVDIEPEIIEGTYDDVRRVWADMGLIDD